MFADVRLVRASAAVVALAAAGCQSPREGPDVVLITADALRSDHLSINGYPRETSPNIDRFASRSWHFTEAVTVLPKTGPAFTTLFTGRTPEVHGVRTNRSKMPRDLPVLAERLRSDGYRTAAFVSNPAVRGSMGFSRGFETFEEHFEGDGVREVNRAFLGLGIEGVGRPDLRVTARAWGSTTTTSSTAGSPTTTASGSR